MLALWLGYRPGAAYWTDSHATVSALSLPRNVLPKTYNVKRSVLLNRTTLSGSSTHRPPESLTWNRSRNDTTVREVWLHRIESTNLQSYLTRSGRHRFRFDLNESLSRWIKNKSLTLSPVHVAKAVAPESKFASGLFTGSAHARTPSHLARKSGAQVFLNLLRGPSEYVESFCSHSQGGAPRGSSDSNLLRTNDWACSAVAVGFAFSHLSSSLAFRTSHCSGTTIRLCSFLMNSRIAVCRESAGASPGLPRTRTRSRFILNGAEVVQLRLLRQLAGTK